MSHGWSTEEDILKDLGVRGSRLDANYVVVGQRPPPTLSEDTNKKYFSNDSGGGDTLPSAPEFAMITKMLQMVDITNSVEDLGATGDVQINKICKTKETQTPPSGTQPKQKTKEKTNRNVALKSILMRLNETKICVHETKSISPSKPLLLTPMDFMNNTTDKSNLQSPISIQESSTVSDLDLTDIETELKVPSPKKLQLILDPIKMFKRKDIARTPKKVDQNIPETVQTQDIVETYTPSPRAIELCKELTERKQKQDEEDMTLRDYWSQVEVKLERIDTLSCKPDIDKHPGLSTDEFTKWNKVLLPFHRHQLEDDCVVCIKRFENKSKIIYKVMDEKVTLPNDDLEA